MLQQLECCPLAVIIYPVVVVIPRNIINYSTSHPFTGFLGNNILEHANHVISVIVIVIELKQKSMSNVGDIDRHDSEKLICFTKMIQYIYIGSICMYAYILYSNIYHRCHTPNVSNIYIYKI